jgi:hypothetical protein
LEVNREERARETLQMAKDAFYLVQPVASMVFVIPDCTNPTAESIPETQRVKQRRPNAPVYPLSTAAEGKAIKNNPIELFWLAASINPFFSRYPIAPQTPNPAINEKRASANPTQNATYISGCLVLLYDP